MGVYVRDPGYKLYLTSVRIIISCTFEEVPTTLAFVPPHALPWRKENRALSVYIIEHNNSWVTLKCT